MKIERMLSGMVLIAVFMMMSPCLSDSAASSGLSIPYVATRNDTVRDMLWLADVGKSDVVYDLGSGDGRVVIAAVRDFGALRAVGIEKDPNLVEESIKNAQKAGVTDRVKFIQGDLFTTDFSEASVVCVFLGHEPNIKLRPKLLSTLKPGTRIVSHQFGMGEWQANKELTVRTVTFGMYGTTGSPFYSNLHVPDYHGNELTPPEGDKIFMWVVPAHVAGIWHGEIDTEQGKKELKFILHQRLSEITGTFELSDSNNLKGFASVDLWGNNIRFWCQNFSTTSGRTELIFNGQVIENTLQGKVNILEEGKSKEYKWNARREKVDFVGTWEWPGATEPLPVKLRIERDEGKLRAKYIHQYLGEEQVLPVIDFYDFNGGFYFTLLIGAKEHGVEITKDTGWLIGEAILENGSLTGRIEFYPYGNKNDNPAEAKITEPVLRDWKPRLVKK